MQINYALLHGSEVYLEALDKVHFPALQQLARDERIWEFTRTIRMEEQVEEQMAAYLATALDREAMGGQQAFVIRQHEDNGIVGMTRFYHIEPKDRRLMIGYTWYTPGVWGKVHNPECKYLLLRYAFETLLFHRVEFQVASQNLRSQRAVEKIGGVKEGVLRKHGYRNDGTLRDTVIYSILDDEWPEVSQKLAERVKSLQDRQKGRDLF